MSESSGMETPLRTNELDIIVPVFNPPAGWSATLLNRIYPLIESSQKKITLILVNDGSTNGNIEPELRAFTDQNFAFKLIEYTQNKGKGYALRAGAGESKSKYLIFTDIDIPFTSDSMQRILDALFVDSADLALGQRDHSYYENIPSSRKRMSSWLTKVNSKIFKLPVRDTQCGLKGMSQKGKSIFLNTSINRYLFDLELVFIAGKHKEVLIKPVPVTLRPDIQLSKMNLKVILPELLNFFKIAIKHWI